MLWRMGDQKSRRLVNICFMRDVSPFFNQLQKWQTDSCGSTGIILAFTIPRVPTISFDANSPLVNSTNPGDSGPKFGTFPATFTFNASLNLEVDTTSNFLPLKFNHLRAEVASLDTSRVIATGDLGSYTVPAKAYSHVLLPLNFNYTAANTTDQTWANMYNACRNKNQFLGGIRPGQSYPRNFQSNTLIDNR
jgi:hypothetical protein